MRPIGRQSASGLSFWFSARRFFTRSAAQGVNGSPSLNPAPTSRNVATGGPSAGGVGAGAACPRCPPAARTLVHMPDRSGLPSANFGAGAVRFGLPSGVLGVFAAGYGGHCAERWRDGGDDSRQSSRGDYSFHLVLQIVAQRDLSPALPLISLESGPILTRVRENLRAFRSNPSGEGSRGDVQRRDHRGR